MADVVDVCISKWTSVEASLRYHVKESVFSSIQTAQTGVCSSLTVFARSLTFVTGILRGLIVAIYAGFKANPCIFDHVREEIIAGNAELSVQIFALVTVMGTSFASVVISSIS